MTIPTGPPEHPILDSNALLRQGMAELERLAGEQWTDFNAHDPGITLLDAICYALNDLGYRTFHPIPDLLAEAAPDAPLALFTPAEALTCHAVTADDLRRVVLDVPGVKNAWIEKVDAQTSRLRYDPGEHTVSIDLAPAAATDPAAPPGTQAVNLSGLWRVVVEKSDLEDIDTSALRRAVAQRLHANRPLCEDFDDIVVLDPTPVAVIASVEIGETENGETVLLGILERIGALISPPVGFLSLDQMLAAGTSIEQAFTGPALRRGFVDATTLPAAERRAALHTSDVIREIVAVPGVRAVRSIRLARPPDTVGQEWSLALDASGAARLDINASRIELVRDRLVAKVDTVTVNAKYAGDARLFPAMPRKSRDLIPTPGRARHVAAYLPLETDLPRIYGLGAGALPAAASPARKAQANQLRAYLTLFDQLLANEFAQLAQLASLLSAGGNSSRSYFGQLTGTAAADLAPVLAPDFDRATLDQMVEPEGSEEAFRRRNRFLNHLLARFGETITDDPRTTSTDDPQATNAVPQTSPAALAARLLDAKRQFLRDMPSLGSARGVGVDYLADKPPAPALVERVRLRLGLPEDPALRFLVVEHILLRGLPEDAVNALPLLEAASRADPWSSQLSFVFPVALQPLQSRIERVAREETPAHLVAYQLWLDPVPFAAFAAVYDDWLVALRRYWLADRLGADPDAPDPMPEATR